jgi:hypothetical protein
VKNRSRQSTQLWSSLEHYYNSKVFNTNRTIDFFDAMALDIDGFNKSDRSGADLTLCDTCIGDAYTDCCSIKLFERIGDASTFFMYT